ncbi:MAG: hypothetical protein ABR616_19185 [Dermatophilaceae bacterium]|nr:hypothetical protein [Intrasporangiaceae bacterium]
MTMVRVETGVVTATRLPRNGYLSDGRAVSGYDQLDAQTLYDEGWREVVDAGAPTHDPETHYVERTLEIVGDEVHAVYTVHERVPAPVPPEAAEREALLHATRIAIADKVKADLLSGDDIARIAVIFPMWETLGTYVLGELRSWDHTLIECLQAHTNADPAHTPDTTPALWKLYLLAPEPGEYPLWVQPESTNPYNATWDDGTGPVIVSHNGQLWENTHGDGNIWEPGQYGWTLYV